MVKVSLKLAFVLLFTTTIASLFAQQPYFRNITTAHGLPKALIYKTIEDSLGYIWLTTAKGILRYNGSDLKEYGAEDGLTEQAFFFASRQPGTNTLIFLSNSFKLFLYRDGKFTHIPSKHELCWLAYDNQNNPWFLTRKGDIIRYQNDSLVPYLVKTIPAGTYYHILWMKDGSFLLSHTTGIEHVTRNQRKTLLYDLDLMKYHYSPRIFRVNNQVLVNGAAGFYRFDEKKTQLDLVFPCKNKHVFCMIGDSTTNDVMVGSVDGLWVFRKGMIDRAHLERYLHNKFVVNLFRTSEGVYIFSTQEHGLYLSTMLSAHFNGQSGLKEPNTRFLGLDGKDLYAFSDNARIYRMQQQKFYELNIGGKFEQPNKIAYVYSGAQSLLFGTTMNKEKVMRINNRKFFAMEKEVGTPVLQVYIDDSLHLTYSTHHIFDLYPELNVRNHMMLVKQGISVSTANTLTYVWYLIDRGRKHFYYTNSKGYLFQDYAKPDSFRIKDLGTQVEFMMKVNNALIVAGTNSKGLALLMKNDSIAFIGRMQGLSGDRCYKIMKTGDQLWVLTDQGLSRLTFTRNGAITSISNFNSNNVLNTDLLNDFLIKDDTVYVATEDGVIAFNKELSFTGSPPRVWISDLSINNIDTVVQPVYELPYDMNNISLSYEYPSLVNAGKILYQYILLKGSDTVTVNITPDKKLQLFSLSSGEYTLLLYAMNADGIWGETATEVKFNISPVFWKSWWFISLISMMVVGVTFVIFQYRNKANIMKNKIIDSELKALRLHMNPHFIFNTLNSLQRFVLGNKPLLANEYIAKFSRLIRWVMEYSDKQEVSIQEEIDFLKLYIELEQLRFDRAFACNITTDPALNAFDTLIPPLVIQPFVENAIKYGLSGKADGVLGIRFKKQDDLVFVTVYDNGVGREQVKKEQEESGKQTVSTGIRYTEERLRLLIRNDKIHPVTITDLYDNHHAAGTRIELLIPILI